MSEDFKKLIIDYVKKEYLDEDSDQVIDENTRLISGGIVDSFSMVSLKRFLETRYQIRIPDAEAAPAAFDTVNRIAELVERHVQKTTAGH